MFEHLRDEDYKNFKNTYRLKRYRNTSINDPCVITQLGYLDVNRTLKKISNFFVQSEKFKKIAIEFIENIKNIPPKSQEEFDDQHNKACNQCCDIDDGIKINYGQAQKLINMSLKYFYNEYAYYKKENYLNYPNNNIEYFFHIPIDSQIINYFKLHHNFKGSSKPWSQWPYKDYGNFQKQLRERLINNYKPLEVDYLVWGLYNTCVTNDVIK